MEQLSGTAGVIWVDIAFMWQGHRLRLGFSVLLAYKPLFYETGYEAQNNDSKIQLCSDLLGFVIGTYRR